MASTTIPATSRPKSVPARAQSSRVTGLRAGTYPLLHVILFASGAVLMPLGILTIALGWYGTAHSRYDYDQRTYLISGGIMGLGLTFLGGFLYLGAWLTKNATDQRASTAQLTSAAVDQAQSAQKISEAVARLAVTLGGVTQPIDPSADTILLARDEFVKAGEVDTIHLRTCPLIADREDLHPVSGFELQDQTCRVCRPYSA